MRAFVVLEQQDQQQDDDDQQDGSDADVHVAPLIAPPQWGEMRGEMYPRANASKSPASQRKSPVEIF